jgi:hypothetical protein
MSCDHPKDNLADLGYKQNMKVENILFSQFEKKSKKTCQLANIPQGKKYSFTSSWQGVGVNVNH